MTGQQRKHAMGKVAIEVSILPDERDQLDARARAFVTSRSDYVRRLILKDLATAPSQPVFSNEGVNESISLL